MTFLLPQRSTAALPVADDDTSKQQLFATISLHFSATDRAQA